MAALYPSDAAWSALRQLSALAERSVGLGVTYRICPSLCHDAAHGHDSRQVEVATYETAGGGRVRVSVSALEALPPEQAERQVQRFTAFAAAAGALSAMSYERSEVDVQQLAAQLRARDPEVFDRVRAELDRLTETMDPFDPVTRAALIFQNEYDRATTPAGDQEGEPPAGTW